MMEVSHKTTAARNRKFSTCSRLGNFNSGIWKSSALSLVAFGAFGGDVGGVGGVGGGVDVGGERADEDEDDDEVLGGVVDVCFGGVADDDDDGGGLGADGELDRKAAPGNSGNSNGTAEDDNDASNLFAISLLSLAAD